MTHVTVAIDLSDNGSLGLWFCHGWGGQLPGDSCGSIAFSDTAIFLRIEQVAGACTGYWSSNGSNWTLLGRLAVRDWFVGEYSVGVFAFNGNASQGAPEIPADFDYFKVEELDSTPPQESENKCLQLDGDQDYVSLPDLGRFCDITVEMWVWRESSTNYDGLFGHQRWSCELLGYQIMPDSYWGFEVACCSQTISASVGVPSQNWHHLAACYSQGNFKKYYLDGQPAGEDLTGPSCCVNLTGGDVWIGCDMSWDNRWFWGKMDEVRVWNYARSQAEIQADMNRELTGNESGLVAYYNFNAQSGITVFDLSPNHHNGTLNGNATLSLCNDLILPVELASFDALSAENGIHLTFTTASETDNDYFEILRGASENGAFTRITTLPSQGNSTAGHRYEFLDRAVTEGQTYWYYLADVDLNGNRTEHRALMQSATMSGAAELPADYSLSAYPNPFNPSTTISFAMPEADVVKIAVFDVAGRWVQTLANEKRAAGNHTVTFDARDLPSGVYFARMESGAFTVTKKMLLIR